MTDDQVARILEAASGDPEVLAVTQGVLAALPHRGDDLKRLAGALELVRAKCIVDSRSSKFWIDAATFFDDLRKICWSLWRM